MEENEAVQPEVQTSEQEPAQTPEQEPVQASEQQPEQTPAPVEEQPAEPAVDYSQFKQLIDSHFLVVKNLLKFNKEKDANVSKLSITLQKYREGFDVNLFKAVALSVISYREDTKKAYREFSGKALSLDTAKKYLGYIVMDYEDMLCNLGVECIDGVWYYNKKRVDADILTKMNIAEPAEVVIDGVEDGEIRSFEDLAFYVKSVEERIIAVLKDNAERDKLLNAYINYSSMYETGVHQAILYPVVRKLISIFQQTKTAIEERTQGLTEENASQTYIASLQEMIENTEVVLGLCSVVIDSFVSDSYDPKKHRMLKTIATDDESKNGTVAARYTDCYILNEKVIYPQKVDIYKK